MMEKPKATIMPDSKLVPAEKKSASVIPDTGMRAGSVAKQPTSMPGVARKRIPVTIQDLQRIAPGDAPDVLRRALQLILETNLEEMTPARVMQWGEDLQAVYAKCADDFLELVQKPEFTEATKQVSRLMTILSEIKPRLAETLGGSGGTIQKLLGRFAGNPLEHLDTMLVEIGQLVRLLANDKNKLQELQKSFEELGRRLSELGPRVRVAYIAANFLADYVRTQSALTALESPFLDRVASLANTSNQLMSSSVIQGSQLDEQSRFLRVIQKDIVELIPVWKANVVGILTKLARTEKPTQTTISLIVGELDRIIATIKSGGQNGTST